MSINVNDFVLYNSRTTEKLVQIKEGKITYINPNFIRPLKKIRLSACFSYLDSAKKEEIFGRDVKEITLKDERYPLALALYCQAQLLTHPESYTSKRFS